VASQLPQVLEIVLPVQAMGHRLTFLAGALALALASALVACSPTETPVPIRAAVVLPPPPPPKRVPAEMCAEAMKGSRGVAEAAARWASLPPKDVATVLDEMPATSIRAGSPIPLDPHGYRLSPLGQCFETHHGAWALVIEEAAFTSNHPENLVARYALVHFGESGAPAKIEDPLDLATEDASGVPHANYSPQTENGPTSVAEPQFFDFDGDGEDEIYLRAEVSGKEGFHQEWNAIYTFHAGHIAVYEPSAKIAYKRLRDIDGDGRPDLVLLQWQCEKCEAPSGMCACSFVWQGMAHSLPDGSFSTTDPVAASFVDKPPPDVHW
jgi:hypothetical protein